MAEAKNYKVVIKTIGPIFIGSGNKIEKSDYIMDRRTKKVFVLDTYKMFNGLEDEGLTRKYEKLVMCGEYRGNLFNLLRDNKVPQEKYEKWAKYVLNVSDLDLSKENLKSIQGFIKDAYGCPYIPGSSLKGAIKSAYLNYLIDAKKEELRGIATAVKSAEYKNRKGYLSNEMKDLNTKLINTRGKNEDKKSILNDKFAELIVSDSKPLSVDDLTLCQKIDVFPDGTANNLPIMRECIKPGTIIEFDVKINVDIFKLSGEALQKRISIAYKNYCRDFLSAFKGTAHSVDNGIYVGGGTGYATKTVTYSLLDKSDSVKTVSKIINNTLSFKAKKEHKHDLDVTKHYNISPHTKKCTKYQNQICEMGLCTVAFQPM